MDLDRPAPVLPVSAAEKSSKLTREGAAGSRLIESHMEEISEGGHESYSVMPENLPLEGSKDQSGRVKPHTCFESLCPLGMVEEMTILSVVGESQVRLISKEDCL
jgi:hypothetical protein